MDITIPVTIGYPGSTIHTPLGVDKNVPATEDSATLTLHLDNDSQALINAIFAPPSTSNRLTPDGLAALYTPAELTAALTKAIAK